MKDIKEFILKKKEGMSDWEWEEEYMMPPISTKEELDIFEVYYCGAKY